MTPASQRGYPKIKQGVRLTTEGTVTPTRLTTIVHEIGADGALLLRLPPHVPLEMLSVGASVSMEYFREDAAYVLTSVITAIEPGDPQALLHLAQPARIKKIQKRRFPRLQVQLPLHWMRVELTAKFEQDAETRTRQLAAWSKILSKKGEAGSSEAVSGSGMRLAVSASLDEGDIIYIELELGELRMRQVGLVTWSGRAEGGGEHHYAVGVEFVGITDGERDDILALVDRP